MRVIASSEGLCGGLVRVVAPAVGFALLAGCPASDLCVPAADSERVVHVQPPSRPGPDNDTVVGTFSTIQSALDAVGGGRGRATVCVADGAYHEEIVVPADTHLVAAGTVRILPPQTRADAEPTTVDRTLLTLDTGPDGPITLDGFALSGAGLCIDARGDGAAVLRDLSAVDCAVGLRVRDADVTLHDVTLNEHAVRAIDVAGGTLRTESNTTLLRNGRPKLSRGLRELTELDPEIEWTADLAGRGAFVAVDSNVLLAETSIDESEYRGAVLDVTGGSLTLRDVRLGAQRAADTTEGFVAGDSGGDGPVISAIGAAVDVRGLYARSEGQGLFALSGGSTLDAGNVDWSGRLVPNAPAGAPGPALHVDGGGTIGLWHASLSIPDGAPGLRFVGDAALEVTVANSIVWDAPTQAVVDENPQSDVTLRYSLFEDPSVTGTALVTAIDPQWTNTEDGFLIASTSAARCAGADDVGVDRDLLGAVRPFTPGKSPDLGAIELQSACP